MDEKKDSSSSASSTSKKIDSSSNVNYTLKKTKNKIKNESLSDIVGDLNGINLNSVDGLSQETVHNPVE